MILVISIIFLYNHVMSELKVTIDNEEYRVIIERKIRTKNLYLRVRDNLDIYVTGNICYSNQVILDFIHDNEKAILKSINRIKNKKKKEEYFYYLGVKYDVVYLNQNKITFGDRKVFLPYDFNLDNWYKKEAKKIFKEELDKVYQSYIYQIPYPSLTIRNMKTRWGVCNYKKCRITLNLELIKKDKIYLDYVIVHELSHLIHHNHSKEFWKCVENNFKDYKKIRKELKEDE